jgi:hypothetical protein
MSRMRLLNIAAAVAMCAVTTPSLAQDALVADRPGFAFSTLTVAPRTVQVEASVGWEAGDAEGRFSTPTLVRIGIAPAWELRVSGAGWMHDSALADERGAWGDLALGVKRHLPAAALGASWGVIAQVDLATGRGSPGRGARPSLGLAAEWTLAGGRGLGIAQGVVLERDASGDEDVAGAAGVILTQQVGAASRAFAELAAPRIALGGAGGDVVTAGIGAAHVIGRDVQIDIAYSGGPSDEAADHAIAIGLSRRW